MRKIMFCAALVVASLCTIATLSAQSTNVKSVTLHHAGIKEIHATVPTCITVANDTSDAIEIVFPADVERYLKIEIINKGDILSFDIKDESITHRELNAIMKKNPIRVHMSSSVLTKVRNTSDMSITFADGSVGEWFQVTNTGTLFVNGEALKAQKKIEYYNTGTFTSQIKSYITDILCLTNTGFLYTKGTTTAKHVEQASTGIENTDLVVCCNKLSITSTGSGVIKYEGRADNVEVTSTGRAKIRTSKLNSEQ